MKAQNQIKNTLADLLHCTVIGLSETASGGFLLKKLFLKSSQYQQETLALGSLFKNVAGLKAYSFIKKRPQNRCFPVNIAKFLIVLISTYTTSAKDCFLTFSMVHCYIAQKVQGLDCVTTSGFRF